MITIIIFLILRNFNLHEMESHMIILAYNISITT